MKSEMRSLGLFPVSSILVGGTEDCGTEALKGGGGRCWPFGIGAIDRSSGRGGGDWAVGSLGGILPLRIVIVSVWSRDADLDPSRVLVGGGRKPLAG